MDVLQEQDVPYGNDWDSATEAAAYGESADQARPWRSQIRDHVAARVAKLARGARVLELGSGPGLLAHRVLERCSNLEAYTLVDFSEPMLALSRERLAAFPEASFVRASFKSEDWTRRVEGRFNCVVSMQAVHELRHKRHAARLYQQVYRVLAVPGLFLVCDHTPFDDSPKSVALYMTEEEQQQALTEVGFVNVRVELAMNGLVLYAGERAAEHLSALLSSRAQIFSVRSSNQEDARPQAITAESAWTRSAPSSFPAQASTPIRGWDPTPIEAPASRGDARGWCDPRGLETHAGPRAGLLMTSDVAGARPLSPGSGEGQPIA